ncbi:MAG TPA: ATP-dependent helicase HrpB [Candidatus Limnocylindria bacterium]|nr:ATP-dependent helicase HrpB [Candidatus Limnocylindria bacterium]
MRQVDLPIFEIEQRLCDALSTGSRLVLTAPTGSGKSTQVPQMLLDGGLLGAGQVTVLQPRRLPTRMLASWVAQARGVKLGGEVGYRMRLDNVASAATRICYVTEGILLRQMLADPQLNGVSALIFDEFHERHLYGDISLARALQIQETTRPDLIIIVMSATLDVGAVGKFLHPCTLLASQGRTFPVDIEYLKQPTGDRPVWEVAVREAQRLVREYPEGDMLIFMPGGYEIARTVQAARDQLGQQFVVFPLHGELAPSDQDAAVARYEKRKIVVATNVAETSLTIDGVRLVIDSGLARIPRFDPYRGINTLLIEKISRAAADQRTGRAGRTAPGHCLRLWTAHEQEARPFQELPEVKRLDLSEVILTLKASGVVDVKNFRWLEAPETRALTRAETLLADLGAIDKRSAAITELGRRMLAFPLHPRYARMLLAAQQYGCVRPVAAIAALTQGRDLLLRPLNKLADGRGELFDDESASDLFVLLRAWRYAELNGFHPERCRRMGIHAQAARQVGPLFQQFLRIAGDEGLDISEKPDDNAAVQRCILLGFSDQLARRLDDKSLRCDLLHGRRGLLARESVVRDAELFVVSEVREVESSVGRDRNLNVMLDLATAVNEEWLRELFPRDFEEARTVTYDPVLRRVVARVERTFRGLVIAERLADNPPVDEAAAILAREVSAGRCVLEKWNDTVEQWILRVNRLREWMAELALPAFAAEDRVALVEHICHGAFTYAQIKDRDVLPVVKSWLSQQQQSWIDEYAPERIPLPRGRHAKVVYSADRPPTLAARIQDLYDIKDGIWIANRRVPVSIQVLAPSNRPVQVTENLAIFWRETYPQLKQQLQRRYPKHEWR